MTIDRLQTPSLVVEKKILLQNAETMKKMLEGSNAALRPHYKSHKCAALARWQVANGAKGMTCAKLEEAEDLADAGIEDILIANEVIDPRKIRRMADLAGDCRLTVCVDHIENALAIAEAAKAANTTVHCLVEYEIGMRRCGVKEQADVLKLAEVIGSESHLTFDGIQAYAGHISHLEDAVEREAITKNNASKLRTLLKLLADHGMEAKILSGASTGTAEMKIKEGLYNEIQVGSYLFMDSTYRTLNLPFKNSLFLLSSVVSVKDGLTVLDAGVKTCGVDQGMPDFEGCDAKEIVANEEHFQFHGLSVSHRVGDRILLIPGHCCSTVNLHDRIYVVDDGKVVDRLAITARGFSK